MSIKRIVTMTILFTLMVLYGAWLNAATIPVCVLPGKVDSHDAQGFIIEGADDYQQELVDSATDLAKNIQKSKTLSLTCNDPAITLIVVSRGWGDSGQFNVWYNQPGQYVSVTPVQYRHLVVLAVLADGRTKEFSVVMDPSRAMMGMTGWGGMAKDIKKQVEDFIQSNKVVQQ